MRQAFVGTLITLFLALPVQAQTPALFGASSSAQDITPLVWQGVSTSDVFDPAQVHFVEKSQSEIQSGYSAQDQWLKLRLKNDSPSTQSRLLYLDSPLAGHLWLFKEGHPSFVLESGPGIPYGQRHFVSRQGAFEISLAPYEEVTFYLKRSSHHALNTRVILSDIESLARKEHTSVAILFFYMGGMFSLAIYNFIIGLFSTQRDHISYSFFALAFGATALCIHGIFDSYLFSKSSFLFSNYLMLFSSLCVLSGSLFVRRFLNIGRDFAFGFWGLRVIAVLSLFPLLASFFVPYHRELFFMGYFIDILIAVSLVFFTFCGLYSLFKKNSVVAYYFLLSWIVVLGGVFVWLAALHGFIKSNIITHYSVLFANLGEMLVLSLGLAYKIRVLDDEKRAALQAVEEQQSKKDPWTPSWRS